MLMRRVRCACGLFFAIVAGAVDAAEPAKLMKIDGKFYDWARIPEYTDPPHDQHEVLVKTQDGTPRVVKNPNADLIAFKLTHDSENLYAYFKARGRIGRTVPGDQTKKDEKGNIEGAGRFYAILAIDVDQNDETGYWLHEGGYHPTSRGYDVNCEVEWYGGTFNSAPYLNHCCMNEQELAKAFLEQSTEKYVEGNDGPYPAGFMRLAPGTYKHYTQWVYHEDDTLTFVRDKGPIVHGIVSGWVGKDEHEAEICFPFKGFLKDENGKPIIAKGYTLDVSFSLEVSGELSEGDWASDTANPIEGYVLE